MHFSDADKFVKATSKLIDDYAKIKIFAQISVGGIGDNIGSMEKFKKSVPFIRILALGLTKSLNSINNAIMNLIQKRLHEGNVIVKEISK